MKLLITGGTGSFGSTVLRRLLASDSYDEIRVFSRDELKQDVLRNTLKDERVRYLIGDVREEYSISAAVKGVDAIFHAAALKQVPSCEFFPIEATKTNVFGTFNMLNSAERWGVNNVVVLSTDKAVYPINAMGVTKALMERTVVAKSREVEGNRFCLTRYGNVMASRGSVIPLFVDQAKKNLPLTITNPDMTRFLMSLDESVDLVQFALVNARAGDLFVMKAPASTVLTLAEAIRKIFNSSSEVKIIGTRHGEKLYESLLSREERSIARDLQDFYVVPSDNRDLNYSKYFTDGDVSIAEHDYNSNNTVQLNVDDVIRKLMKLDFIRRELEN